MIKVGYSYSYLLRIKENEFQNLLMYSILYRIRVILLIFDKFCHFEDNIRYIPLTIGNEKNKYRYYTYSVETNSGKLKKNTVFVKYGQN